MSVAVGLCVRGLILIPRAILTEGRGKRVRRG